MTRHTFPPIKTTGYFVMRFPFMLGTNFFFFFRVHCVVENDSICVIYTVASCFFCYRSRARGGDNDFLRGRTWVPECEPSSEVRGRSGAGLRLSVGAPETGPMIGFWRGPAHPREG